MQYVLMTTQESMVNLSMSLWSRAFPPRRGINIPDGKASNEATDVLEASAAATIPAPPRDADEQEEDTERADAADVKWGSSISQWVQWGPSIKSFN